MPAKCPPLTQTANRIASTRNQFGDMVYGATTSGVPCSYRDISTMSRAAWREDVQIDGTLWFGPDHAVKRNEVYEIEGTFYRIERVLEARDRLSANILRFYKCEVTRQRQIS